MIAANEAVDRYRADLVERLRRNAGDIAAASADKKATVLMVALLIDILGDPAEDRGADLPPAQVESDAAIVDAIKRHGVRFGRQVVLG